MQRILHGRLVLLLNLYLIGEKMDYFKTYKNGIIWRVKKAQKHFDDIEMSGFMSSFILSYGVDETGNAVFSRCCVFPTLRTHPNNTHSSLRKEYDKTCFPKIKVNGKVQTEKAKSFFFDGILKAETISEKIKITHEFFPVTEELATAERVTVKNMCDKSVLITLTTPQIVKESQVMGCKGIYVLEVLHDNVEVMLKPGEKFSFGVFCTARLANTQTPVFNIDKEIKKRKSQIKRILGDLKLETDNKELDTIFRLSAIRAGESIFHTISGDMHSPGGKNYYAATWCNDQLEYAAPWFALTGEKVALKATENAFLQYAPFMSDEFLPIPSSVINEGLDFWNGAGDRGDAAMYLYGGANFLLFRQEKALCEKLWPYIKWCAEYCIRKISPEGVVCSDADELENRIPTDGYANLSTSCLCYGGLKTAAKIAEITNEYSTAKLYNNIANDLRISIEKYFGKRIHKFETYCYSRGFETLRAWICLPICVGIDDRKSETVKALFSDYLYTKNGILSCELGNENKDSTTWDRTTLYAFKAAMIAGEIENIWDKFAHYIHTRLCGERVPYPVEAYPENNMRHLSAESALFCRLVPEGILNISCEGKRKFSIVPKLPKAIKQFSLKGIAMADKKIDIFIINNKCTVICNKKTLAENFCGEKIIFEV